MILPLLVLIVLVAVAAAGVLGIGALSAGRRQARTGLVAMVSAPVALAAGVLLLAVLLFGVDVRGRGAPDDDRADPPASPTTTLSPTARPTPSGPRSVATTVSSLPRSRLEATAQDAPVVTIEASDDDEFSPYRPVSGLAPGGVVRVRAGGFGSLERGEVEQCVVELGRDTACGQSYPLQFDEAGRAEFPFAIRAELAPGACRVGQPTCLLRVNGVDSGRRGSTQVVMVDLLLPGRVTLTPARGVADGQAVEVAVSGFPAGVSATAVLCAPPDAYDPRRCASPASRSSFTVDAGGSGRTTLEVAAGRLGADGALCGPRRPCAVAVVVGPGFVTAPPAPVTFSAGPGVEYTPGRMATGISIAIVLVAVAVAIALRTDWSKPAEAATPELDGSDLQVDASLDDLFGTDEELDEREPIPW